MSRYDGYSDAARSGIISAKALEWGSSLAQRWPALYRWVGGSDDPLYVPVRWRHSSKRPAEIARPDLWAEFPGSGSGSGRPATFKNIALLSVERDAVDSFVSTKAARHAVAYMLSASEVMVGALDDPQEGQKLFDCQGGRYVIGMRLGPGTLRAAMGVVVDTEFFALNDTQTATAVVPADSNYNQFV